MPVPCGFSDQFLERLPAGIFLPRNAEVLLGHHSSKANEDGGTWPRAPLFQKPAARQRPAKPQGRDGSPSRPKRRHTKSRLLLDFSRGAQRGSPVCCDPMGRVRESRPVSTRPRRPCPPFPLQSPISKGQWYNSRFEVFSLKDSLAERRNSLMGVNEGRIWRRLP